MGRLFVGKRMAIRAGKPLRMQSIEKIPVALLFVEKISSSRRSVTGNRIMAAFSNVDGRQMLG